MADLTLNDDGTTTPTPTGNNINIRGAAELGWDGGLNPHSAFNPAQFADTGYADVPAVKSATRALQTIHEGIASAIEVRTTPNPLETLAQHHVRVKQGSDAVLAASLKAQAKAVADLDASIKFLNEDLPKQASLKPGPQDVELRAALKAMSPRDRSAAIARAVEDADTPLLSAVLYGHSVTHGVEPEGVRAIETQLYSKMFPQELKLREQLYKVRQHMTGISNHLNETYKKLVHNTDFYNRKIEQAQQLKAKAGF